MIPRGYKAQSSATITRAREGKERVGYDGAHSLSVRSPQSQSHFRAPVRPDCLTVKSSCTAALPGQQRRARQALKSLLAAFGFPAKRAQQHQHGVEWDIYSSIWTKSSRMLSVANRRESYVVRCKSMSRRKEAGFRQAP